MTSAVLILGSGPQAADARNWGRDPFSHIVAINNAWRVRPDWDASIFPEDLPPENRPPVVAPDQQLIEADQFVPMQNRFGGFVYAGGTMAFTAAYWALGALKPSVMAFFGCDLVYPATGRTHFYGTGTPDPLRDDVTLQSLEAKSARLQLIAAAEQCACVNLSTGESRLVIPRADLDSLAEVVPIAPDAALVTRVQERERALDYFVESGRYWEEAEQFDPVALAEIDALWLEAHQASSIDGQVA